MRHLNPVYKRELKQTARTKKTLALLCIYNLLLAGLGLFVLYVTFDNRAVFRKNIEYSGILTLYSVMTGLEFVMVLLIIPSSTAGAIAGEREKQTLDILLSSGISTFQIMTGKLAASISTVILLAISSLPVLSIVFSIGGITLRDMFQFVVLVIVTAIYLGSIGIFFSVCCRKTTSAAVSAYITILALNIFLPILIAFPDMVSSIRSWDEIFSFEQLGKCFAGGKGALLLFDPLLSFVSLIRDQTGRGVPLMSSIGSEGRLMYFLEQHWFTVSMACQLAAAWGLTALAAHKLNPAAGKERGQALK